MTESNKRGNIPYIVILIFLIGVAGFWLIGSSFFSEEQVDIAYWVQAILIIIVLCLSTIFLTKLARLYRVATQAGKVWLLLALGMLCWTLGEVIYTYINLVLGEEPFPSIADLFYLLGYFPLAIGLIAQTRIVKVALPTGTKALAILGIVMTGAFITVAVIIYPVMISLPIPEEDVILWVVGAAYPILDILLVASVIIVFAKLRKGAINIAWVILLLGMVINVAADTLYNWVSNVGVEEMLFEIYDLLFLISYTLVFASTLKVASLVKSSF